MRHNSWIAALNVDEEALESRHGRLRQLCRRAIDLVEDNSVGNVEDFHCILNDLACYAREQYLLDTKSLNENFPSHTPQNHSESLFYENELTDMLMSASAGVCDRKRLLLLLMAWWTARVVQPGQSSASSPR